MSLWARLFGKKTSTGSTPESDEMAIPQTTSGTPSVSTAKVVPPDPASEQSATSLLTGETAPVTANRRIRVFISSTFRDMIEERDALMTHAWPALRQICQERHVELVEVDLRWGIAEEQSTRKETLKLCLDEIRACRPFFIGLLGERYGWTPGDDAFTADLNEEQPWLRDLHGKSVTELEILHGVLNTPDLAGRAFFYFRDPAYAQGRGPDFLSETDADAEKQTALKTLIRTTCAAKQIPLQESYPDPRQLAAMVLADLSAAVEARFPKEQIPDPLSREAQDHEAFAEIRRRTYIGRTEYFEALDRHAAGDGGPLVLLGDSGGGKSALLANWVEHWRKNHPKDVIIQHYIGGTADSADHWRLMARVMGEIKRCSGDPEALPTKHDDIRRDFPLWLANARNWAAREGVRFILVLDALNQLDDHLHARLLGWLPEHPFTGPLRLIASTLPGASGSDDPLDAIKQRNWQELHVQPLTVDERRRMITDYLVRFGKKLDEHRLVRLASAAPAANPLYLKILLDDLRITGTYDRLDERLTDYLAAADIPALLQHVLARYERDYERDRPGLVAESLGLIYASRRGLSETELLELLRPAGQAQLPPALWTPLRAALEDALVDRGGILNFSHDFLRTAVGHSFAVDVDRQLQLAYYFETQPITARTCDELPWLLKETESNRRLRACLLHIDRFLLIKTRDEEELRRYWVEPLHEQQTMGTAYLGSFEQWSQEPERQEALIAHAAGQLASFLLEAALYAEAEPLMRRSLEIDERNFGKDHPEVAIALNNLAGLLHTTNRIAEAEPLLRRALEIHERSLGKDHPEVATVLNNLAHLLKATNRLAEAEPLMRRALEIDERSFGKDHPNVARDLNNLATLFQATNRLAEAEPLFRRALEIDERSLGKDHPEVARDLNNLAQLLQATNRLAEAEPLIRRALEIDERGFGKDHPNVAIRLSNLAGLLQATNRLAEAEPLFRRALEIDERSFGKNHTKVAIRLNNLAQLLQDTNRLAEAEPLYRRAIEINERSLGKNDPEVAGDLNNLATLFQATNRLAEAEPLMRRSLEIDERSFGKDHPNVARNLNNLAQLLQDTNRLAEAEPLYRRAIEINERSLGKNHPKVATVLNNLAQLLQDTNRLAEAEPLIRRAIEIDERSFGKDHPNVARNLNNLAHLLKATNRLAEAEPLMRRALDIDERSFGEDHPNVARNLNNLATLLQATNRLAEAEPLYRRALDIDERSLGKDHPNVARDLNNLATFLGDTNRLAEAEPLMRRALEIDEHSFGKDHPNVARNLNNLATLFGDTNRLAEAEPLMRRALEIDERSFGENHPNVAIRLNNLGQLLKATNQLAEAEPLMRRALEIDERSLGKDHPKVALRLNNLGQLLQATNRLAEAEPLMRRALEIDERSFGENHPNVAIRLNNLAQLLKATNQLAEAEPLMRRAVEILLKFTRATGHAHPHLQTLVSNYAQLLQEMGRSRKEILTTLRRMAPELFEGY
jgi:tetratricopeptide (TPR) repeat protein